MPGLLGVAVAFASFFVPLSYDEGNWLAVVRRMQLGEVLYRDLTDNKTPPLFWLVRGLDAFPGPYVLARAVWLGVAAALVAVLCGGIARTLGFDRRSATLLGTGFGAAAAAQAVLVVNFELPAVVLVLGGLYAVACARPMLGGLLAAVGCTFDLRAFVLVPGMLLFAYAKGGTRRAGRFALVAGILAGAWGGAILLVADLRYSLVELNAATRGGSAAWDPAQQAYALIRGSLIPVGVLVALSSATSRSRDRIAGVALLAGGSAVVLASIRPFDKYGTLLVPGLLAIGAASAPGPSPARRRAGAAIVAAGALLAAAYAVSSNVDQRRIVDRYERVAAILDRSLDADDVFIRFDTQPFLGAFLPARDRLPAAVLDFVIADTSRRPDNHRRIEDALARASVLVDDGALSLGEDAVLPQYRPLWRVFSGHVAEFPCVVRVEGLTLRYRAASCPAGTRTGSGS